MKKRDIILVIGIIVATIIGSTTLAAHREDTDKINLENKNFDQLNQSVKKEALYSIFYQRSGEDDLTNDTVNHN